MQNLLKLQLVSRYSLRKTERLILEEGTSRILEAWTMFLWEVAEDLNAMERTLTEVKDRLEKKKKGPHTKQSLLEEIDRQKELISHLEEALKEANSKLVSETEMSFEKGVKAGRNIAEVEELGVLEEIKILKEIQSLLEDNADNSQQSHQEHSKFSNILL